MTIAFLPADTCPALSEWPSRVRFADQASLVKHLSHDLATRPGDLDIEANGSVIASAYRLSEPHTVLGVIETA